MLLLQAAWAAATGQHEAADAALDRAAAGAQGEQAAWPHLMRAQLAVTRGVLGQVAPHSLCIGAGCIQVISSLVAACDLLP